MLRCSYCSRILDGSTKFHDAYVDHMVKEGEYVPVFCDKDCLLRWAAARKRMSRDEILVDYANWLEGMG